MNSVTTLLALVLVAALVLAVVAVRMTRMPVTEAPTAHRRLMASIRTCGYIVERSPADAVPELRLLRRDFLVVWHACRWLAPESANTELVPDLIKTYFAFHAAYFEVRARLALGFDASADGLRLVGRDLLRCTEFYLDTAG